MLRKAFALRYCSDKNDPPPWQGETFVAMPIVPQIDLSAEHTISRVIKGGWHLAGGHGHIDRRNRSGVILWRISNENLTVL